MRYNLAFIFLVTTALAGAQKFQPSVDTFFLSSGYGATRLMLSADSSFYIADSDCTQAWLARGKWVKEKRVIKLLAYGQDSSLVMSRTFQGKLPTDDTSLILQIVDCFNRPVSGYCITIFDSSGTVPFYYSDSSGMLKVSKNTSKLYFTCDEFGQFDFSSKDLLENMHPLTGLGSSIIIQLNYPKELLFERSILRPLDYKGNTLIKTRKGLAYKNSRDALLRKL